MASHEMPKYESQNILLNSLGSKHSLVMKLFSLCNIRKEKKLSKNSMKNVSWKLVQTLFNFQRILSKKESKEVCVLIWTSFNSFAITYLI